MLRRRDLSGVSWQHELSCHCDSTLAMSFTGRDDVNLQALACFWLQPGETVRCRVRATYLLSCTTLARGSNESAIKMRHSRPQVSV